MSPGPATHLGYRFPAETVGHALWLHHAFGPSTRDVGLILAERGIAATRGSIRQWRPKFGGGIARKLRRRRPEPGATWHPDGAFIRVNGGLRYLRRAVDQHGVALDILVRDRRNATAAKRFVKHLLAGLRRKPRRIVADGPRSYRVAKREVLPGVRHRTGRYLSNGAENSHRTTRRRERQMQRFKSPQRVQRFLSAQAMIYGHSRPRRHPMTAARHRRARAEAFRIWRQETCVQMAARGSEPYCGLITCVLPRTKLTMPGQDLLRPDAAGGGGERVALSPLRLLAHEYREALEGRGVQTSLSTGEERSAVPGSRRTAAAVEMRPSAPRSRRRSWTRRRCWPTPSGGAAWTAAIMRVPVRTVIVLGAPDAAPMLRRVAALRGDPLEEGAWGAWASWSRRASPCRWRRSAAATR